MTATPTPNERSKGSKRAPKPTAKEPTPAEVAATTNAKIVRLPDALRSYHDALVRALARPFPIVWDDEVTFVDADQPREIARVLIKALHPELVNAEIGYVFRKKLTKHDRTRLAQASKVGGKLHFFSRLDLLIEVNHDAWFTLTDERRVALIDHELTHFARAESEDGASYELIEHDIEEFGVIVRRWGFWTADVERFAGAIDKARQLDIFDAPIAAAAAPTTVQ